MSSFESVLVLFLLIVVGFTIKKLKIISNNLNKEVSNLIINITLPAFLINAMNFSFSYDVLMESGRLILISVVIYIVVIGFSYLICRWIKVDGQKKDIIQYSIVFPNVGYMGYPVIQSVYGKLGVFYAALFNLPFNILVWTLGIYFMTRLGKEEKKVSIKRIINPGLVAIIIGFTMFILSVELPSPIHRTIEMLGSLTIPLAMIFIGSILADMELSQLMRDRKIFLICIVRLLLIPIIVFAILKLLGASGHILGIPVILTAMPVAANAAILASKYKNDYRLSSKIVFLSTILSLVTIPLIVMLVK